MIMIDEGRDASKCKLMDNDKGKQHHLGNWVCNVTRGVGMGYLNGQKKASHRKGGAKRLRNIQA